MAQITGIKKWRWLLPVLITLITDGRFSGAIRDESIGHVCLEAASGGNIGLLDFPPRKTIELHAYRETGY